MCGCFHVPKPFSQCMFQRFFSMMRESSSSSSCSVQTLYELCKKTFTPLGTAPASSQAIHKLSSLLDTIGPADVGLKEENQEDDRGHGLFGLHVFNRVDRWAQPITYIDVHECDSFMSDQLYSRSWTDLSITQLIPNKMCIFCFPTSSVIPLHDHPGMTVLSKILYGSLHVKAYDWVEPMRIQKSKGTGHSPVRLAKLAVDKVLTAPCDTSVLFPKTGGNLHCFTAITPCAVLDILAPPYLEAAGRKCTYYHDYPYSSFSTGIDGETDDGNDEEYAWLAEVVTPDDLYMRGGRYTGPAIHI